ncbi:MAG: HEAT repeat domain-containing protein [Rhodospirillales bacterium]|nr:HEAT repeat domain-containing protein [Rhodospirillales bacterium]
MSLTQRPVAPAASDIDPVQAIAPSLAGPDDIIRCAAARALGALGGEGAAAPLVDVLMDPDPDLRVDAMTALARCARPKDAPAIRRSLEGDPVGEVKVAAIRALARLKDESSVSLLQALARSRCDDEVAWEDENSGWDEWLDVQVAAIEALGVIGADEAVDDLLKARADEEGQDLDHAVFAALARMPGRGLPALRSFLRHADARVRERALDALAAAGREALTPLRETLVRDASPRVRRLAIDCFDNGDETLTTLALNDPNASVRAAVLGRAGALRPEILRSALRDPDETVRAVALEARGSEPAGEDEPDLVANVEAWLRTGGVSLATVCAAVLPTLAGGRSLPALGEAAMEGERPTEVRIAALRSLGGIGTEESLQTLRRAVVDRARQLRLAALAALVEMTKSAPGDIADRARMVLTDAVRGSLAPAQEEAGQGAPEPPVETSLEPAPQGSDDETSDTAAAEPAYPRSTLEAIGGRPIVAARPGAEMSPSDDDTGSSKRIPKLRPGRVAVEGPDDIGEDLRLTALRLAAACTGDGIDEAIAEAAGVAAPTLRTAAFEAIAQRAAATHLPPRLTDIAVMALKDRDPTVRATAAWALAARSETARHLAPLLGDPDDRVRAAALKAVAKTDPEKTARGFRDPSPAVRGAALDAATGSGNVALVEKAVRMFVDGGFADTLVQTCRRYPIARQLLLATLGKPDEPSPQARLMILEAMSHAVDAERIVPAGNGGEGTTPGS